MRHLFECVWIALLLSSAPVSPLLLCSPGYYVNGAACSPCPAGYFNGIVTASGMSTACIACPPGTCNKNAGASVCALCPHYQQNWVDFSVMADSTCACAYTCNVALGCSSTTKLSNGNCQYQIANCGLGYYMNNALASCLKCALGQGSDSCVCSACPPGKYNGVAGNNCVNCPPGKYTSASGLSVCASCPANTYMSASGYSACASCPAGYTSPAGSTDCNPSLSVACVSCTNGFYVSGCSGGSAGTCTACSCPEDRYAPDCGGSSPGRCIECECSSGYYPVGCAGTSSGTCEQCTNF